MKRIVIEVEDDQLPFIAYGEMLDIEVVAWGPWFRGMFVKVLEEQGV